MSWISFRSTRQLTKPPTWISDELESVVAATTVSDSGMVCFSRVHPECDAATVKHTGLD